MAVPGVGARCLPTRTNKIDGNTPTSCTQTQRTSSTHRRYILLASGSIRMRAGCDAGEQAAERM